MEQAAVNAASKASIKAFIREKSGTSSSRALRREQKLPAIVYGLGDEKNVVLDYKEFKKIYDQGRINSRVLKLELNNDEISVLPREVQLHPVSDLPLHVDFQELKPKQKIKVFIPVTVKGEDKSPGLKRGGILNVVYKKIPFVCEHEEMLESLTIDVAGLEIGAHVHIQDLKLPESMKPVDSTNFTVASISGRVEEESEEGAEGDDAS